MNIILRCLPLAVAASAACAGFTARAQYTLTTLATGSGLNGGLAADASGNLYGTTQFGGANHDGTLFELAAGTHTLSTLVTFSGTNGIGPQGSLLTDASGNLYGTTDGGGDLTLNFGRGYGTVFMLAAGTHALTTLAVFKNTNGAHPNGGLIADASGNLYGTTIFGGDLTTNGGYGDGTVFKVAAGTHALSVLVKFNGANGWDPEGSLLADASGNLYGTTAVGGANDGGTVFKLAGPTHALSTLASFNNTPIGTAPGAYSTLVADAGGNLYGTTAEGGDPTANNGNGYGALFEVAAVTHALTNLVTFNGANGTGPNGLITDASGNLYGTTSGTFFKLAAGTHAFTTLFTFNPSNGPGPNIGALLADASGNLYGTTSSSVFELSPAGAWTGASSANWADSGNWSSAIPGAASGTTNTDTAFFNQNAPFSPLSIDVGRNLQSITFDTASVNSLTIGTIGGNALLLTAGGTIQTTSTVVNPQSINALLVLEGDYTFTSGATSNSATFSFGGGITPGATSGITTLTLNGTNTGENTITGVLADNGAGRLAVTKSGTGLWILSGANTNSGDIAVTGGTLRFNITSGTPTIAAGVTATVASGATLELAGSISALGTPGGNRAHVINSSTAPGVLVSGTHQVVAGIDGTGNLQVNAGSDLTADHIIQAALIIGGSAGSSALVTIAASDSSGNPLGEPSTLALAGSLIPSNSFGDGVNPASLIDGAESSSSLVAGASSGSYGGVGSSAVPEPSTMMLLVVALVGLLISARQARGSYRFARNTEHLTHHRFP